MITYPRSGHTLDLVFKSSNAWINLVSTLDVFENDSKNHCAISDHNGIFLNFDFVPDFAFTPTFTYNKLILNDISKKSLVKNLDSDFSDFVHSVLMPILNKATTDRIKITINNIHKINFDVSKLLDVDLNELFAIITSIYKKRVFPHVISYKSKFNKNVDSDHWKKTKLNKEIRLLTRKLDSCTNDTNRNLILSIIADKHRQRNNLNISLSRSKFVKKVKSASRANDPTGKNLWKLIKSFQVEKTTAIEKLKVKGTYIPSSNSSKMAKVFADYFSKVGSMKPSNFNVDVYRNICLKNTEKDFTLQGPSRSKFPTRSSKKYRRKCNKKNICNALFSFCELQEVIKNTPQGKASGDDFWDVTLAFDCPNFLFTRLILYNLCWIIGYIPDCWRDVLVCHVFKSGNRNPDFVDSYRPIALMSLISKEYQRLIKVRLVWTFEKFGFFDNFIWGFRKGRSSDDLLLDLAEFIKDKIHNNYFVGGIFLDIKKAFDCLNREQLKFKLSNISYIHGRMLESLTAYLDNYQIRCRVNGFVGKKSTCKYGGRQGDVLMPLLWIIFFDVFKDINADKKYIIADDGSYLIVSKSINELQSKLEVEFKKILAWGGFQQNDFRR